MPKKNKRKTLYMVGGVLLLVIAIPFFSQKPDFTASTEQSPYADAFIDYANDLAAEGLILGNAIQNENGETFIFILVPESGEISQEEVDAVGELVGFTSRVLEFRGGFMNDNIDIAFTRPKDHRILLIERSQMPALLSAEKYGEMTLVADGQFSTSLINLAGPIKNYNLAYSEAWSVIQSVCLAYTIDNPNHDPICNIFSANAAAGWAGIKPSEAESIINAYGKTSLEYLGSEDLEYRFIDFVYNEFAQ